ncbi:MAG: hypothetical protein J5711_10640 [Bacteroidales bacterium]|nr:hypothetical protein [Bacteroidales bacterium]
MKRIAAIVLFCAIASVTMAQSGYDNAYTPPDVAKFVKTLTKQQQEELKAVTTESKKTLEEYRRQLIDMHKEIQHYYGLPGDRSSELFPLYAQRSALYVKIDQAKYRTKMRIDKILTEDQQKELRENLEHERQKREIKKQLTMFLHPSTQK